MKARTKALAAALIIVGTAAAIAGPYVVTAAALLDLAGRTTGIREWMPVDRQPVVTRDERAPTRYGPIPVRVYTPAGDGPALVVLPGIHGGGVDAPRLARFCGQLASTGSRVVCAPLPDLREFRVTSRSTDMIEDVTVWAEAHEAIGRGRRVALVAVSFAGGLAVVAAGRPALQGKLTAVVAVGGHGDLTRTLTYLTTGLLPDGRRHPPHDYGLAVAALAAAPHLLTGPTLDTFRQAVRTYLEASLDDSAEQKRAAVLLAEAKAIGRTLPPDERRIVEAITARDTETAGRWVRPAISKLAEDPGLSPSASPPPTAPVFLMHGRDDNVIPSSETTLLAADLSARGTAPVRALISPFISHAELGGTFSIKESWRLLRFWHTVRQTINGS